MRSERHRPSRRELAAWTVVAAVPLAIGVGFWAPSQADAAVDLPDKTAEELLDFVRAAEVDAFSGTIEQTAALGLPDLEGLLGTAGGGRSAGEADARPAELDDLLALLTESHTARVYVDGDQARLQVLDQLAERNVYIDGDARAAWFVDSETKTATHVTVPDGAEAPHRTPVPTPTPEAFTEQALAALDETTEVSVGTDGRVAGRDAYELVLDPRADDTLVGEVRIAIDGEVGVPLAVTVTARGAEEPAFELAFVDVSFTAPDASVFAFEPGDGVAVVERPLPVPTGPESDATSAEPVGPAPIVHGEGWSTVVELPNRGRGDAPAGDVGPEASSLLNRATVRVDGGRVLETALVSVLFADDGRVLVGAVTTERLVEAAQAGR